MKLCLQQDLPDQNFRNQLMDLLVQVDVFLQPVFINARVNKATAHFVTDLFKIVFFILIFVLNYYHCFIVTV